MDAARKHSLHSAVLFHTTTPSVEQWLHVCGAPLSGTATGTTICSVCTNNFVVSYTPRTFEICAEFSYAQNTGTDARQSEQKVTGREGLSKRRDARINECDARAGRKLGNKFGRAIQFSGVAGGGGLELYSVFAVAITNEGDDFRVRRFGRFTFVARPLASSSTMAYHPKSICH